MNLEEAVARARTTMSLIEAEYGARLAFFDGAFGVDTLRETGEVYVFRFNSTKYLASGDILDQFLMGPIVVPKDGSDVWLMGTALSEDDQLSARR